MSHEEAAAIAQEIEDMKRRRDVLRRELAGCHGAQAHLSDPLQRRLNERRIKDRAEELATIEAHLSIFEHYGAADVCQSRRCAGEM